MFSRFKKSVRCQLRSPRPPPPPAATAAPQPSAMPDDPPRHRSNGAGTVQARQPAEVVAADKEKKRKERLTELKVELHKRLLDNLNLAALETATEAACAPRSQSITAEALDEMSVVLNKDDRHRSTRNFTTRSWALARWSRC